MGVVQHTESESKGPIVRHRLFDAIPAFEVREMQPGALPSSLCVFITFFMPH